MPEVWQTIEQAAVTLGLSVRTVNRHITGGKLQSRLFEGRREVLVSLPEPVRTREPVPRPTQPAASPAPQPVGSHAASTATPGAEAAVNFTMGHDAPTAASATAQSHPPHSQHYDSVRRAMSADFTSEKPLDMQTMLTLADSVDDKASLAVAAYQTLAHSAEVQVQSLRRVALGAWASVGLLAAGAIVAVGWGTYRLTWAEGTAASLRSQVDEQKGKIQTLESDSQVRQRELEKARLEAATLQMKLEDRPSDDTFAQLARALDRLNQQMPATQPVGAAAKGPAADGLSSVDPRNALPATAPSATPATMPAIAPTTQPTAGTATVFKNSPRPNATQPSSMPAMTGDRPSYLTNSREAFDAR